MIFRDFIGEVCLFGRHYLMYSGQIPSLANRHNESELQRYIYIAVQYTYSKSGYNNLGILPKQI